MNILKRFVKENEGQDLIEYGLLLGLITIAVIGVVTTLGTDILNVFTGAETAVSAIPGAAG